ncbi:MAG: helix-turn-helix domain-containing protein [Proteobacteria bacterium]|nr:helix-turn-helix domain-containing protein [Pseudomonadota bacterium]
MQQQPAHQLTQYRQGKELSLEAFGTMVGASKSMVYKWENGVIPRRKYMDLIQAATNGEVPPSAWYATGHEVAS